MKNKTKRKRIIKLLNKICKELPQKEYSVAHKFYRPVYQDVEGNIYPTRPEGIEVRLVERYIQKHIRNQKRLCLHIYDRFGLPGVGYYFDLNMPKKGPVDSTEAQGGEEIAEQGDTLPSEKVS